MVLDIDWLMKCVRKDSPGLPGVAGPFAQPPVARQANVIDNEFVEIRVDVEENPERSRPAWILYLPVLEVGQIGALGVPAQRLAVWRDDARGSARVMGTDVPGSADRSLGVILGKTVDAHKVRVQ